MKPWHRARRQARQIHRRGPRLPIHHVGMVQSIISAVSSMSERPSPLTSPKPTTCIRSGCHSRSTQNPETPNWSAVTVTPVPSAHTPHSRSHQTGPKRPTCLQYHPRSHPRTGKARVPVERPDIMKPAVPAAAERLETCTTPPASARSQTSHRPCQNQSHRPDPDPQSHPR